MSTPPRPVRTALRLTAILSAVVLIGGYIVLAQRRANATSEKTGAPGGAAPVMASGSKNLRAPMPSPGVLIPGEPFAPSTLQLDGPTPANSPALPLDPPRPPAAGNSPAPARAIIMPGSKSFAIDLSTTSGVLTIQGRSTPAPATPFPVNPLHPRLYDRMPAPINPVRLP